MVGGQRRGTAWHYQDMQKPFWGRTRMRIPETATTAPPPTAEGKKNIPLHLKTLAQSTLTVVVEQTGGGQAWTTRCVVSGNNSWKEGMLWAGQHYVNSTSLMKEAGRRAFCLQERVFSNLYRWQRHAYRVTCPLECARYIQSRNRHLSCDAERLSRQRANVL